MAKALPVRHLDRVFWHAAAAIIAAVEVAVRFSSAVADDESDSDGLPFLEGGLSG